MGARAAELQGDRVEGQAYYALLVSVILCHRRQQARRQRHAQAHGGQQPGKICRLDSCITQVRDQVNANVLAPAASASPCRAHATAGGAKYQIMQAGDGISTRSIPSCSQLQA